MRGNKRMEINKNEMEQLEAVSGGTRSLPDYECEHVFTFSGPFEEQDGKIFQWGTCLYCDCSKWVRLNAPAEATEEQLFAPAAKK